MSGADSLTDCLYTQREAPAAGQPAQPDIPVPAPYNWRFGASGAPEARPFERGGAMTAPTLPASCTGDCDNGSRDCTCGGAIGMWDDERAHPSLAVALYLGAFALAIVASIAGAVLGSAA